MIIFIFKKRQAKIIMSIRISVIHKTCFFKIINAPCNFPQFPEAYASVVLDLIGVVLPILISLRVIPNRLLILPQLSVRVSSVEIELSIVRVLVDRPVEVAQGVFKLAQLFVADPLPVVVVWVLCLVVSAGASEIDYCSCVVFQVFVDFAAFCVGFCVVSFVCERLGQQFKLLFFVFFVLFCACFF